MAFIFQDKRQIEQMGERHAPWYVGWKNRAGRRCNKKLGSKSDAKKYKAKVETELAQGSDVFYKPRKWSAFTEKLENSLPPTMRPNTRRLMLRAVKRFGELMAPGRLDAISVDMIEQYVAKRSEQRGQKQESKLAIQTINKDLRHLKAALNRAVAWGWLPKLPKIKMLKAPKKLPRFVTPEHFAAIYQACDKATRAGGNCDPADWWRALIVFAYMTGWRIGECLAVRRADVDLDAGTAITRAEDNKAGRDEIAPLHPLVVEHLRLIPGFSVTLFDWPFYDRALWEQFGDIQRAAGINLDCHEQHEHTPSCHVYGFHDLRRGFATQNAPLLPAIELQARMRHVSFQTTQEYINLANQLAASTDRQFVPSLKVKAESA